jgi:PAS domain S-box-containing protein
MIKCGDKSLPELSTEKEDQMFDRNHLIVRYLSAIAAILIATLLRFLLAPVLGQGVPFILHYPTIVLCAWFGGLSSGLLATVLGGAIAWYAFIPARYSLETSESATIGQLLTFLLSGVLISLLGNSRRRAQKKTELSLFQELRRREELRVTLASIGDGVITTDADGRVTFLNSVAETLTGRTQAEAVGKPFKDVLNIINEKTGQPLENLTARVLERKRPVQLPPNTILISKDGTERFIEDSIAPLRDENGAIFGVVLIFRDISERKRAEEALYRLAAIVESSADIIIGKTLEGVITSWNKAAERIFGYTAAEAVGQSIYLIIPNDRHKEEEQILARLAQGERIEHYETVRQRKDGSLINISLTVSPILDREGHIIGASKIARDITERRRIEEQREQLFEREKVARARAEEAGRLKDEFLATVSHELRSPLNSMMGWLHLIQGGRLDSESVSQAIDTIERNARSQLHLIEDLLEISRSIMGKTRLNIGIVDLASTVKAALDSIRPAADAKGIRLETILDPMAGPISGDTERLQQVVWNLLSNAIKFTPKAGRVQIILRRRNSHVEITVADTGQGISQEFLPHVFDRFKQASAGSTRKHGGLGLGLAIVRNLVELHGGTVLAESPGEGKGATFIVKLPMMIVTETVPAIEERWNEFESLPTLNGLHLLVVDDSAEARNLISAVLKEYGAEVSIAASAEDAREILKTSHIDVIISDIEMPEEDGYSLIRSVRATKQTSIIPAIALTAYARSEDRRRAMIEGFQFHISKPVEPSELIAVIASLTGRIGEPSEH